MASPGFSGTATLTQSKNFRPLLVVAGESSTLTPPDAIGGTPKLPSLVWLEQVAPGRFERRALELGSPLHASLDAADFDGDGDIDLAVGNLSAEREMAAWVEIWENQTVTFRGADRRFPRQ